MIYVARLFSVTVNLAEYLKDSDGYTHSRISPAFGLILNSYSYAVQVHSTGCVWRCARLLKCPASVYRNATAI